MGSIQSRLLLCSDSHHKLSVCKSRKETGRFWHWERAYILKDIDNNIYSIRMNIFERIYANIMGAGLIEEYFIKTFTNKKIVKLVCSDELNIRIYNAFRLISNALEEKNVIENINRMIEKESTIWRGNSQINLQTPDPYLNGPTPRQEWWGRMAERTESFGLQTEIFKITKYYLKEQPIAVDLGCGSSSSIFSLLRKGWKVICVDYSQKALTSLEGWANNVNPEWLRTKQLTLVCSNAENYILPNNIDLVYAGSALPYFNPKSIQTILTNIFKALTPEGHFIGNFFATKYVSEHAKEFTREMGGWFLKDEDSVGYLLANQGFELVTCKHGQMQNPHSIIFDGIKPSI
ncbi:MAG: class I SAM-dependent methyltransferase [Parachlamydiaceae bacterium]|nr:class I SAM-dependent methyltransferase [Parachlamydiaceae bacterium]